MLIVTMISGCNNEPPEPPEPQAVVINIQAIVEATGIKENMQTRAETMTQQLSEEMSILSADLNKEIEDERASIGNSLSEDDEKKIQILRGQKLKEFNRVRAAENKRLAEEISEIRQSYLDGIMSVAKDVALEHGASIVLKAMGVFWSDESVDVTDEVIERMSGDKTIQPAE